MCGFRGKGDTFGKFFFTSVSLRNSRTLEVLRKISKFHLFARSVTCWHIRCHLIKLYNNWNLVFFVEKVTPLRNFYPPQYPYENFVLLKFCGKFQSVTFFVRSVTFWHKGDTSLLKLYNNWKCVFFVEKVTSLVNIYPPQYPCEIFVLLRF